MLRAGSGCALVALLAVALAAVPAAADEEPAAIELPTRPSFDPRAAVTKVAEYQAAHPEFAAGIATWVTAGISLFILGNVVLVWSEIQAMLGRSLPLPPCMPRPRRRQLACTASSAVCSRGVRGNGGGRPYDGSLCASANGVYRVQWCGTRTSGRGSCCRTTLRRAQTLIS